MLTTETEKISMQDLQSIYESYLTPSDALVETSQIFPVTSLFLVPVEKWALPSQKLQNRLQTKLE